LVPELDPIAEPAAAALPLPVRIAAPTPIIVPRIQDWRRPFIDNIFNLGISNNTAAAALRVCGAIPCNYNRHHNDHACGQSFIYSVVKIICHVIFIVRRKLCQKYNPSGIKSYARHVSSTLFISVGGRALVTCCFINAACPPAHYRCVFHFGGYGDDADASRADGGHQLPHGYPEHLERPCH